MKDHSTKWLHHAVCCINALAALHIGLTAFGYNILGAGVLAGFATPLAYIFGLSGLAGLVFLIMHVLFCDCAACGSHPLG